MTLYATTLWAETCRFIEPPRDQVAKLLGLHQKDVSAASLLATLPEEVQQEFYSWAEKNNPSRKAAQEKIKKMKKELKTLKEVKALAKKQKELARGMTILQQEGREVLADAEAANRIALTITSGYEWLTKEAGSILALQVTPRSINSLDGFIRGFIDNLDAYRTALVKKFTYHPYGPACSCQNKRRPVCCRRPRHIRRKQSDCPSPAAGHLERLHMLTNKGWYLNPDKIGDEKYTDWRIGILYKTNARTAHSAGRYRQQTRTSETRPFLVYKQIQRPTKRIVHEPLHNMAKMYCRP